jgi:transcriptional antiterminator NusG
MLMRPKGALDVVQGVGDIANDRQVIAIERAIKIRDIRINDLYRASRGVMADTDYPVRWICLEVWEGRESAVINRLDAADIETLIPWLDERVEIRRGRKVTIPPSAVYRGYVFVHCAMEPAAMQALIRTKHVSGLLGGAERPHVIGMKVINNIMRLTLTDDVILLDNVQVGNSVYVTSGPFVFLEGTVLSVKKRKARIEIAHGGRRHTIEMPLAHVRKL